jgi:beta-fructofuranosidase
MYSGRGFREWEIGDIDIIKHDGTYHLFHLVLPNHDYIAHAVSKDCINWTRVKNALFVGDPGEWDDDMLWTMNVCHVEGGGFEMFYTGLSQEEHGYFQRIGHAMSPDLFKWTKDESAPYPIESVGPHYESPEENERQWVSFRDPFHFCDIEGSRFLLLCARTTSGVVSRRGCVGLVRLSQGECYFEEPLFIPRVYDDVECPAVVALSGRFYLIGSIREDVRVHYWHADSFRGDYRCFPDNVLLPEGNYAARVSKDGDRILLYSFFVAGPEVETANRYFCPPKELETDASGRLILKSLGNWRDKIGRRLPWASMPKAKPLLGNKAATVSTTETSLRMTSRSGYELAGITNPFPDFIWRGTLIVHELGKMGLVFNADADGNGYYIHLEPLRSSVQIRAWSCQPENIHKDYLFEDLQAHTIPSSCGTRFEFELLRYGHYIEFSVDGIVRLSLVDAKFRGEIIGLYGESTDIERQDGEVLKLKDAEEDELSQHFDRSAETWQT